MPLFKESSTADRPSPTPPAMLPSSLSSCSSSGQAGSLVGLPRLRPSSPPRACSLLLCHPGAQPEDHQLQVSKSSLGWPPLHPWHVVAQAVPRRHGRTVSVFPPPSVFVQLGCWFSSGWRPPVYSKLGTVDAPSLLLVNFQHHLEFHAGRGGQTDPQGGFPAPLSVWCKPLSPFACLSELWCMSALDVIVLAFYSDLQDFQCVSRNSSRVWPRFCTWPFQAWGLPPCRDQGTPHGWSTLVLCSAIHMVPS